MLLVMVLKDAFLELHCDYVVSGGQTMNPSDRRYGSGCKGCKCENM